MARNRYRPCVLGNGAAARHWWEIYAKPNLAYNTLAGYAPALDKHVLPRLGSLKLRDVTPEVLGRFRADLERRGSAEAACASRSS